MNLYVCNIYQLGVADVEEVLDEVGSVDAIVTMSAWNRYSPEAKELAQAKLHTIMAMTRDKQQTVAASVTGD
jgi:hypothetical protein